MYDPNVRFIREVEVFHASNLSNLIVYFFVYENSAEQQAYLNDLSREKASFEKLIHQKAHMMLHTNLYDTFIPDSTPTTGSIMPISLDTRSTCSSSSTEMHQTVKKRIIVDVREFRSALPSMLHRSGLDLSPVTLEVGDFVLTPRIVVERKSVSDLFGSFKSGRLVTQVENMLKYYPVVILLIEFSESKSFSLQDPSQIRSEISASNIVSKMTLLALHFPKVHLTNFYF